MIKGIFFGDWAVKGYRLNKNSGMFFWILISKKDKIIVKQYGHLYILSTDMFQENGISRMRYLEIIFINGDCEIIRYEPNIETELRLHDDKLWFFWKSISESMNTLI